MGVRQHNNDDLVQDLLSMKQEESWGGGGDCITQGVVELLL
jgi:hypothetical protein